MKRTFAILMTLLMLFSASALAETAATTDATATAIPKIVFDETAAAFQGNWLTFDNDGFMVYMPSDWVSVKVTDELLTAGTYYAAKSADGAFAMTVSYSAKNDATTNEELAAKLTEAGYENVSQAIINGIGVVGYDMSAQDVSGMAFMDSEGGMYVFSFTPASNETFAAIGQTIITSLSPIPAE